MYSGRLRRSRQLFSSICPGWLSHRIQHAKMAPPDATKKVLEDFMDIYINRTHPCLWQIKNKEYHNRAKKEAAYTLLIEKLSEIEPDANTAVVVKKINNLRSNVRKEKKKYELSLKSGASADDVYCIKLWYYDLFDFINDQCTPRESSSNLDSDDENSCEGDNTQESSTVDQQKSTGNNEAQSTLPNNNSSRPPKPGKAKRNDETIANELMESVRDHFKRPRPNLTEDRCDIIGKNVAMKLRALDAKLISVAEKLINDLIFEAEIGHLTPEHAYINMREILRQHQRSYVPAQQYTQQVYYQSSPTSNRTYTPVSFVSSGSPSPPCLPFPSSQHSEHLSQSFQTSHVLNSPQANPYSTQMQTPTIPGNQPNETEVVVSIPDSAPTFLNNINVDDNV